MMKHHRQLDDQAFKCSFEGRTLLPEVFNHEAHLRLAWIYLEELGVEQTQLTFPRQLRAYVSYLDAEDKYHETLTRMAIRAIEHFRQKSPGISFYELLNVYPALSSDFKNLINSHYTFDLFALERARSEFVAPDIL